MLHTGRSTLSRLANVNLQLRNEKELGLKMHSARFSRCPA